VLSEPIDVSRIAKLDPADDLALIADDPRAMLRYQLLSQVEVLGRPIHEVIQAFGTNYSFYHRAEQRYRDGGVLDLEDRPAGRPVGTVSVATPVLKERIRAIKESPEFKEAGCRRVTRRLRKLYPDDPVSERTVSRVMGQLKLARPRRHHTQGGDEGGHPQVPITVTVDHQNQVVTRHGAAFVMVPYLEQVLNPLVDELMPSRSLGLPPAQLAWLYGFERLVGGQNIHRQWEQQDPASVFAANLGHYPVEATLHQALHLAPDLDTQHQIALRQGQRYQAWGLVQGKCLAIDPHMIVYYTDRKIPCGWHSLRQKRLPGFRPHYVHDLDTDAPFYVHLFPANDRRSQRLPELLDQLAHILGPGKPEELYFDSEFASANTALLLDKQDIKFCFPLGEQRNLPALRAKLDYEPYDERRLIGQTTFHYGCFPKPLILIDVWAPDKKKRPHYSYASNHWDLRAIEIVSRFRLHWRVENMLKDDKYGLATDHLPGGQPEKVMAHLLICMALHDALILFQRDLGAHHHKAQIATLQNRFFDRLAHLHREAHRLAVQFLERFRGQSLLESLMTRFAQRTFVSLGHRSIEMAFI
jgi:hypothetical protein